MPAKTDRVDGLLIGAGAYPAMGDDWEVRRQTGFHRDPNVRRLTRG